jgi:peptidoglycan/LPS O-acetylase OafA/YrhL
VRLGCVAIGVMALTVGEFSSSQVVRFSGLGLGFSAFILLGVLRDRGTAETSTKSKFLERMGDYSYGLYLVHVPVITIILAKLHSGYHLEINGLIGAVATAAALVAGWYYGKVDLILHRHFKNLGRRTTPSETGPDGRYRPLGLRHWRRVIANRPK